MRMPPPLSCGIFDFFPGVVLPAVRISATASREAPKSAHAQLTSEDTTGVRRCVVHLSGNQNNSNKLFSDKAMPLFGNTFSPKKTPPRKSASLSNLHTNHLGTLGTAGRQTAFGNGSSSWRKRTISYS
ncbi:protein chibby homolog 1 isoform X2 [Lacerta agilis]|uniref:protein chibby homolog 1 isoform X2 n=1 Tax=Lacerta agilis TaxID=80427 RepID=UPI00141992A2|nr:protein chibby homolog 1 isoform X2 [Lacerta agilis]